MVSTKMKSFSSDMRHIVSLCLIVSLCHNVLYACADSDMRHSLRWSDLHLREILMSESVPDMPVYCVKVQFQWKVEEWSVCPLLSKSKCNEVKFQTRNIICVDIMKKKVNESSCLTYGAKPRAKRPCLTHQCLKQIESSVIIRSTEWTECKPKTLASWLKLSKSSHPNLTGICPFYSQPVPYVQSSKIRCELKPNVTLPFKLNSESCLELLKVEPVEWRFCFLSCYNPCTLSSWSEWKTCKYCVNKSRYKIRTRNSLNLMSNGLNADCPATVKFEKQKQIIKQRKELQYKVSDWLVTAVFKREIHDLKKPQFIFMRRNITCITQNRTKCQNSMEICTLTECTNFHRKLTIVRVAIDNRGCQLSDWTNWTTCYEDKQIRTREIIRLPLKEGTPCQHFKQQRNCSTKIFIKYKWYAGNWSHIKFKQKLAGINNCTAFYSQRYVFCMAQDDVEIKPVPLLYCNITQRPPTEKLVYTKCRETCIYSSWSVWSNCSNNTTKRSRTQNTADYKTSCNRIIQKKECHHFEWSISEKIKCILQNKNQTCGKGYQQFEIKCRNKSNEKIVQDSLCDGIKKPKNHTVCTIPCSNLLNNTVQNGCIVGLWSRWSACQQNLETRHRNILYQINSTNKSCPGLLETRKCFQHCSKRSSLDTDTVFWQSSHWTNCAPLMSTIESTPEGCVIGSRSRDVVCMTENDVIPNKYCDHLVKPKSSKSCRICTQQCVLSSWSDWFPRCNDVCLYINKNTTLLSQRNRFILDHGTFCKDNLIETTMCRACEGYQWTVNDWDLCVPTSSLNDGAKIVRNVYNGIQRRLVYCSLNNSKMVFDAFCYHLPKPIEFRECQINYMLMCALQPWSDWSKCSKKCENGFQRRSRRRFSSSCRVKKNVRFDETRACNVQPCRDYITVYGKWSSCYRIDPFHICADERNVNTGIQYRNVSCHVNNTTMEQVANQYCENVERNKRLCSIPCNEERCMFSSWSTFSTCSKSCGAGEKYRTRKVLKQGKYCLHLTRDEMITETIPCRIQECYGNKWAVGPWNDCEMKNGSVCGLGTQNRSVRCINNKNGEESSKCDLASKPTVSQQCQLYCSTDCILSEWTLWNSCTHSMCQYKKLTTRKRYVLMNTSSQQCVPVEQQNICEGCYTYKWVYTNWSSCIIHNDSSVCGEGLRTRFTDCVRHDNLIVERIYCENVTAETLIEKCFVQCSDDITCDVSPWSPWSTCRNKCDETGFTTRRRSCLSETHNQQCSAIALKEVLLCPAYPCYKLILQDWEECKAPHSNSCGSGIQHRNAYCKRSDGNQVELNYCPEIIIGTVKLSKTCYVPCWNDCIVSPWSSWSKCFSICNMQNKSMFSHGLKSRSRVVLQVASEDGEPCTGELEQQKTCDTPSCYSFAIKKKSTIHSGAKLLCERSDGQVTSYGCKSSDTYKCKCPIYNSECINTNYCQCYLGYVPVLDKNGFLLKCIEQSDNSDVGGDILSTSNTPWIILGACVLLQIVLGLSVIVHRRIKRRRTIGRDITQRTTTSDVFNEDTGYRHIQELELTELSRQELELSELSRQSSNYDKDSLSSGVSSASSDFQQFVRDIQNEKYVSTYL